jgi:hypothetical protein
VVEEALCFLEESSIIMEATTRATKAKVDRNPNTCGN